MAIFTCLSNPHLRASLFFTKSPNPSGKLPSKPICALCEEEPLFVSRTQQLGLKPPKGKKRKGNTTDDAEVLDEDADSEMGFEEGADENKAAPAASSIRPGKRLRVPEQVATADRTPALKAPPASKAPVAEALAPAAPPAAALPTAPVAKSKAKAKAKAKGKAKAKAKAASQPAETYTQEELLDDQMIAALLDDVPSNIDTLTFQQLKDSLNTDPWDRVSLTVYWTRAQAGVKCKSTNEQLASFWFGQAKWNLSMAMAINCANLLASFL